MHELETFARFGAELEPETRRRLERGRRLREALKQPRLRPLRLAHEIATLFSVQDGALDAIPVDRVPSFLEALSRRLDELDPDLLDSLERTDELGPEAEARLRQAVGALQRGDSTREAS